MINFVRFKSLILLFVITLLPMLLSACIKSTEQLTPVQSHSVTIQLPSVDPEAKTGNSLFIQGLLTAKSNGKWGYVDKSGEFVIQPEFDCTYPFAENGLALIKNGDKFGYINLEGEIVIAPQFWEAESFTANGLAAVSYYQNDSDLVNGYINEKGEFAIKLQSDIHVANSFSSNGLACVWFGDEYGGKGGYINENGEIIIKPLFSTPSTFSNGLAAVVIGEKYGFINEKGELVISPKYDYVHSFTNYGLAAVLLDDKWGFINKNGEMVIESQYTHIWGEGFNNTGIAAIGNTQSEMRFINSNGETIFTPDMMIWQFYNGLAFDGAGYIDIEGNTVISAKFAAPISSWLLGDAVFRFFDDGYAVVHVDGLFGIIDKEGNYLIEPKFEDVFNVMK